MKSVINFLHSFPGVAVVTLIILSIPLIAMQFTNEVNWSFMDFAIMGILIFSTGSLYVLLTRFAQNLIYRLAMGAAIGTTFLLVWANLAVGLIGAGAHAGNLMYIGVVMVVLVGTFISKFTAKGMGFVMLGAALSLVLVAIIALLANMQAYPGSSVGEIIAVNAFFIFLYLIAALLFRYVTLHPAENRS